MIKVSRKIIQKGSTILVIIIKFKFLGEINYNRACDSCDIVGEMDCLVCGFDSMCAIDRVLLLLLLLLI